MFRTSGKLFLTDEERTKFGDALDAALDAHRKGDWIRLQDAVTGVFVAHPDWRDEELPRLLEAEGFYFNGAGANLDLRVRFAKRIYRDLIALYPRSDRNDLKYFRIGAIHVAQGYDPETIGVFAFLIENYPESDFIRPAKLLLGHAYLHMGQPKSAAWLFLNVKDDADGTADEHFDALTGLGVAMMDLNSATDAQKYFDQVIRTPNDRMRLDESVLFAYAKLLGHSERSSEALAVFEEFLVRFPNSEHVPFAMYRAAEILFAQKRADDAFAFLRRLTEQFPEDEWGYAADLRLGDVLTAGEPAPWSDEAEQRYRRVIGSAVFPRPAENALFGLARMYTSGGRYVEAMALLDDLASRPIDERRQSEVRDVFAVAFERFAERTERSREYTALCRSFYQYVELVFDRRMKPVTFERILRAYRENSLYDSLWTIGSSVAAVKLFPAHAKLARAQAQMDRGRSDEAELLLADLMATDAGSIGREAALERTRLHFRERRFVAAVESAEKGLEMAQASVDRAELLIARSLSRLETGETVASAEGFRQSIDLLLPASTDRERALLADALFGLGRAFFQAGQKDRAKPVLGAALSAFPEDGRAGLAVYYLTQTGSGPIPPAKLDSYWKGLLELLKRVDDWRNANAERLRTRGA
ncbi:MAG: tetratricopeptide repeat protein [Deltaproteobacteria bacterium]|nr:tetratricopeptide repeat protein [Deltaproteobacteria bacterium]